MDTTFKQFWLGLSVKERTNLAQRCCTTATYLRNVAYGYRQVSPRLAAILEKETGGKVTRKDFFPTEYAIIWPELV